MTVQMVVDLYEDEPVPFVLTGLGKWATDDGWVTTAEAAEILQLSLTTTAALAARGFVTGRKVGQSWLLKREGVEVYLRERRGRRGPPRGVRRPPRRPVPRVSAEPLVARVELRGGLRGCGAAPGSAEEAAFYRARRDGWLTEGAADRLAVRLLGMTPQEVWGDV
jgi:excisionase family DNA binding protein